MVSFTSLFSVCSCRSFLWLITWALNNITTGFLESSLNWGNPNEDVHFFLGSLEHSDTDSLSSSIGTNFVLIWCFNDSSEENCMF